MSEDFEAGGLNKSALALALPFFAVEGAKRFSFGALYTKGAEIGIVAVAIGFGVEVPACGSLEAPSLDCKEVSIVSRTLTK